MNVTRLALAVALFAAPQLFAAGNDRGSEKKNLIFIEGGTFQMGDVFDEGIRHAQPVHEVTLAPYYLGKFEVTVQEFAAFVDATSYVTSAEGSTTSRRELKPSPETSNGEPTGRLARPGAWALSPGGNSWESNATWRNPHYEQGPEHPVTCVSWLDAISYCNWLSAQQGLPPAYDLETEELLDSAGNPTTDVTKVKGYRLPTEAEWEYAARERGRKVRFGNGQDIARSTEMNINAAVTGLAYAEEGEYRGRTTAVGTFKPNALGLYDMSGNLWEWCSDLVGAYEPHPQTNPYQTEGLMGPRRAARGGPWAGDGGDGPHSPMVGRDLEP